MLNVLTVLVAAYFTVAILVLVDCAARSIHPRSRQPTASEAPIVMLLALVWPALLVWKPARTRLARAFTH